MIEFTKLSEVPSVEEIPDGASVLIETENEIKRAPADGMGGGPMVYYNVRITEDAEHEFVFSGDTPRKADVVSAYEAGLFPVIRVRVYAPSIFEIDAIVFDLCTMAVISNSNENYIQFAGKEIAIKLVDDGTSSHWEYGGI